MNCKYFGICGSCTLFKMDYKEQLEYKIKKIEHDFKINNFDIIESKPTNFRTRAEFKIYHRDNNISYAMYKIDKRGFVEIDSCSIVESNISSIMPKLLDEIKVVDILKDRLFSVEFLTSKKDEILVTLIYHKKIDESWRDKANDLAKKLNINLIGRSRGIKIVITKDYIDEVLTVLDKDYFYRLYDTSFVQPNTTVNEKMIGWVKKSIKNCSGDLLELYCGHGNFTIPLSELFRNVLATEISKKSILSAKENCKLNSITNIEFVRLSSQELTEALNGVREFKRLKDVDLNKFSFDAIFVDPPRAGLDNKTIEFIKEFKKIIYISCNPTTLKRDLETLLITHAISNFAIFDQFCYTTHIECGVILSLKQS